MVHHVSLAPGPNSSGHASQNPGLFHPPHPTRSLVTGARSAPFALFADSASMQGRRPKQEDRLTAGRRLMCPFQWGTLGLQSYLRFVSVGLGWVPGGSRDLLRRYDWSLRRRVIPPDCYVLFRSSGRKGGLRLVDDQVSTDQEGKARRDREHAGYWIPHALEMSIGINYCHFPTFCIGLCEARRVFP